MKFRKKPVVIEAFQWTGGPDQTEDPEWVCAAMRAGSVRFENAGTPEVTLMIDTLEGTHRANRGDWIIQGVKGELYPCKPDIFEATYERADVLDGRVSTTMAASIAAQIEGANIEPR